MTNRQKRNSYKWLRLVALWTVLSFTVTSGVNPSLAKAAASSLVPVEIKVPLLMDSLNLPTSLGELQNEYRGGSQTEIIHIQDAHANAGAQQKTVEILSLLQKEHGVDLVFLEGGKGEHDARAIDFFQNSELNDQFADKLIEQGMLSGTEKFLLQESTHVTVLGVEDLNLYKQNLTAYREVLSKTPAIEAYLYKIQTDIRFRIDSHFNPKLKNFFREWVFHREVSEALLSQLHSLKKYAGEVLYQDLNDVAYQFEWPHLLRFFKLEEFESQINKGLALEELEAVMKWADTHQMKKEVILKLKSFDESNQSVSLNKRQVLEQFYREATKDQFSFQDYPEFSRYAGFQILKSELDAMHLMREMDALTKEILAKLTQTDVEKEILKDYHGYLLSKKLLSLELSDSEYEEVLTLELETEEIKDLFEKAHKFYELAKKRETAMVQNMTQKMKELGKTKAVLVSGGFHAKGIHQILQGQGISNVQIMPHVETVSSTASYREIMFAGKGDLAESSYLKHINPSMTLPVVATIDPVTAAYYAQTYLHVLEDFIEETHTTQGSTPPDMGRQFQGVVTSPAVTVNGFGKNWIEAATKVVFEGGEDFVTRAEKSPPIRDTPEKETPNERQSDLPKTTRSEARYYDDGEDDVIVIRRTPEFYDDDFEDDFLGLTKVSHKLVLLGAMIISVGIIGWLMERSSEQPRKKQTPVVRTEVQEEVTQPEAKTLQEDQRQASIPNVVPIPDHSRITAKPVRTRPDILDYAYLPAEHQNRITRSESREERIDAALKMGDYKEAGSVYVELRAEQGDNQTIKQKIALTRFSLETLKESTNRIKWYRAIENLKALETVELVQVTIAIARGIEMKLSLPKFAFNDEKYDESLYRYIASWVFHMGAIYGTDFVGIGVEGDESLVDVDRIIKLLKVEGLQDIRPGVETSAEEVARREKEAAESGEAVAEREPLGINKYANASQDVRILPLQELTDEMRAKLRFDQTKDVDPDYAGNYLGIDIGGSGIKFGVKRGGNYITLPENLAKIETILIDEFGNEQLETGAEWVARVAAHAAKIKERLGIQFDGVGMDAPGTADLQNNRMMTLGQVEQKQKWTNEGIEQVWTIVEEVTKAIDLPVEKGVIRNDMDAVMPGVVSVLPKVKEDFWKRTKGNFRFDWHGTGHGHQYSFGGLPFPGPTEAHVIYDFGKPGEDIFDTERHTSIPGMLDYARKAGFPDTQGKFLPVGLAAADKEDPNHKIAMDTFKQFAKHYAQNLALGYYMMESTGIGVADTVLLGGGPMSGESGRIFRDLTIKELAKYHLDTKIDIELLTNKEIESAGAISSIDDIGPYGAASLIQSILQTRSEARGMQKILAVAAMFVGSVITGAERMDAAEYVAWPSNSNVVDSNLEDPARPDIRDMWTFGNVTPVAGDGMEVSLGFPGDPFWRWDVDPNMAASWGGISYTNAFTAAQLWAKRSLNFEIDVEGYFGDVLVVVLEDSQGNRMWVDLGQLDLIPGTRQTYSIPAWAILGHLKDVKHIMLQAVTWNNNPIFGLATLHIRDFDKAQNIPGQIAPVDVHAGDETNFLKILSTPGAATNRIFYVYPDVKLDKGLDIVKQKNVEIHFMQGTQVTAQVQATDFWTDFRGAVNIVDSDSIQVTGLNATNTFEFEVTSQQGDTQSSTALNISRSHDVQIDSATLTGLGKTVLWIHGASSVTLNDPVINGYYFLVGVGSSDVIINNMIGNQLNEVRSGDVHSAIWVSHSIRSVSNNLVYYGTNLNMHNMTLNMKTGRAVVSGNGAYEHRSYVDFTGRTLINRIDHVAGKAIGWANFHSNYHGFTLNLSGQYPRPTRDIVETTDDGELGRFIVNTYQGGGRPASQNPIEVIQVDSGYAVTSDDVYIPLDLVRADGFKNAWEPIKPTELTVDQNGTQHMQFYSHYPAVVMQNGIEWIDLSEVNELRLMVKVDQPGNHNFRVSFIKLVDGKYRLIEPQDITVKGNEPWRNIVLPISNNIRYSDNIVKLIIGSLNQTENVKLQVHKASLTNRSEAREVSAVAGKFFPKILAELKTIQEALGVDLQTLEDEASENIQAFFYASLPSLLAVAEEGGKLTELDQAQSAVQSINVAMDLVYDELYTVSAGADAAADDLMNLMDQLKTALGKIEVPKKVVSEPVETDLDEDAEFDAWVAEHGDDVDSLFEDETDSGDSVVNDLNMMMNILNQPQYEESWGWVADILAEVMSDVAIGENASAAERMTTLESQVEDLDAIDEIKVELSVGTRNIRQAITSLTESLTNRSEARGEVRVADDDFEAVSRVGNDVTWRVFDVSLPVAIQERLVPEAFAADVSAVEAFRAQGSGLMDEMIADANRANVQENQVAVLGAETSKEAASSVDLFSPNAKAVVAYFQGNKQSIEAFKFAINELNQLRVSKGLVEIKVVVNARELRDTVASFAELGFEKEQIVGHYMTQTDAVALKRADVETLLALDLKNIESPAAKALQNLFQKMMAEALIRIAA